MRMNGNIMLETRHKNGETALCDRSELLPCRTAVRSRSGTDSAGSGIKS